MHVIKEKEVHVVCKGVIILIGKIDYETVLCQVTIGSTKISKHQKNSKKHSENIAVAVTEVTSTKKELVRFLHDTCF